MTRVVVDPGVLVSAFISPRKAAPVILIDAILDGKIELVASPTLIAELTEVLGREKFAEHAGDGRAAAFIALLEDRAEKAVDVATDIREPTTRTTTTCSRSAKPSTLT